MLSSSKLLSDRKHLPSIIFLAFIIKLSIYFLCEKYIIMLNYCGISTYTIDYIYMYGYILISTYSIVQDVATLISIMQHSKHLLNIKIH